MFKNTVFKPSVDTVAWFKATAVRTVKTFAQTLGGFVVVGAAMSDIQWKFALSVSAAAAIACVCTSVAGLPEVQNKEAN